MMLRRISSFVLAALVMASWSVASAQTTPRGTLNRFRPGETPEDDFHLSRASDLGHLRFGAQLHIDYGLNPLVYEGVRGDSSTELVSVVEHQLTGTLGLSLGLLDRIVLFAGIPVTFVMDGSDPDEFDSLIAPADGAGLADLYLGGRVRLVGENDEWGSLSLQATLTLPTSDSNYRGEPSATFHPELLAEVRPGGGSRLLVNVGFRLREETQSMASNLEFGHELTYGVGFAIPVFTSESNENTHLDLHVQGYGQSALNLFGEREGTAFEATAGLKLFHESGFVIGAAAGPGLNRGFGSPDLRVIGMLAYVTPPDPPDEDADGDGILNRDDDCAHDPEDFDEFEDENGCPDRDNDQDNILDVDDQCPNDPENYNGVDDEDGCPDEIGDQDGDGYRDNVDGCPAQAEDFDDYEDEDGCPDLDHDGDGVLDEVDDCPSEAGVVENRGCPDSDRDGDTVVDRRDNCPDEPGPPANHGCAEEQQVVIQDGRLEILDQVFFRTNRATILRRSYGLLNNVARVLNAHPEIQTVHVEGHTDARGRYQYNIRLSQQRAEAVVRFLRRQGGVAPHRLVARGYGPDRPIVPNASSPEEHAQNRRVEFNIPDGSGIEQRRSGPGSDAIDR